MAKAIATVGGVALAPGISRNGRLYSKKAIAGMVARVQDKITSGSTVPLVERDEPIETHVVTQLTHHAAEDDSTRIVGRVTSMSLDESGRARFTADIAPTDAGRTIAALLDTSDGTPPFLRGVSGRMAWVDGARITQVDGRPVETGDELDLMGLDYTHKPGVTDAAVDTFQWTQGGQRSETTDRVLIYESVQEAHVVPITEATTKAAGEASCAEQGHACCKASAAESTTIGEANATPAVSKRDSGLSGTGRVWADPGYQPDKKQRYDISTKDKAKAAWSYINQQSKAAKYTSAQLKRIKGRIKAALKKFGVTVSATEAVGWCFEAPARIDESSPLAESFDEIREYYGDPDKCGSWYINASNGPINISLSCYGMDPADLDVILRAAADAACKALAALDPDMDGDIDVPGAPGADNDGDAGGVPAVPSMTLTGQESAPEDPADPAESEATPAPDSAAGETEEREESAMPTETTNTTAGTAPVSTFTQADLDKAVAAGVAAADEARRARKAAKKAKGKAAETSRSAKVAETTQGGAQASTGQVPAGQETEAQRIDRLVAAKLAAEFPQETDEQRIERLVNESYDARKADMIQAGQAPVSRKGVVRPANETANAAGGGANSQGLPAGFPDKPMHQWSAEEFNEFGSALTGVHVLGPRAAKIA